MNAFLHLLLVSALFALPPVHAQTANPPSPVGLFPVFNQFSPKSPFIPVYQNAIAPSYIDGAAVTVPWNEIEPKAGVYSWSNFDRVIGYALSANKQITVGVLTGSWTPDWLYGDGYQAQAVVFSSYDRSPPSGVCTANFIQPVVWGPVYVSEYLKTLNELAQHLKSVPTADGATAYDHVAIIKLAGIGLTTEELRIDAHPAGGPCNEPDSTQIWLDAGFRPGLVLDAWMQLAAGTAAAFPNKLMSLAVIHRGAFPPIDDSGAVYTLPPAPNDVDLLMLRIVGAAVQQYQNGILVMWDALSQYETRNGVPVLPQEVLNAGAAGSQIGWQLNGFMGVWGGSGCIYPPLVISACKTAADFQSILDIGIDNGGGYLEIQSVDVGGQQKGLPEGAAKDFADAFAEAHDRLFQASKTGSPVK